MTRRNSPQKPQRASVRAALLLILVLPLGACADGGAGAGGGTAAAATTDTVDGVPRIGYAAEGAPPIAWSADTIRVIGDEPEEQFDGVGSSGLAGDAAGDLFLLDGLGGRVLKFGPDGRFVRAFGRKGNGPGELGSSVALGLGPGDSLWVDDLGNMRIDVLPQGDGDARDIALDLSRGMPSSFAVGRDGYVMAMRPLPGGFRVGPSEPDTAAAQAPRPADAPTIPIVRMDARGAAVATLWRAPVPKEIETRSDNGGGATFAMRTPRAFEPQLRWGALPDGGIVVVDGAEYLLHVIDADGTERLRIRRDPPPRATTDADREAERDRIRSARALRGGPRITVAVTNGGAPSVGASSGGGPIAPDVKALAERLARGVTFADVIPRVVGLRVDRRGRIWVGVSEEHANTVDRIDIYEPDGRLAGELRGLALPDAFTGDDAAAFLTLDEDDVQHVTLLRLRVG